MLLLSQFTSLSNYIELTMLNYYILYVIIVMLTCRTSMCPFLAAKCRQLMTSRSITSCCPPCLLKRILFMGCVTMSFTCCGSIPDSMACIISLSLLLMAIHNRSLSCSTGILLQYHKFPSAVFSNHWILLLGPYNRNYILLVSVVIFSD